MNGNTYAPGTLLILKEVASGIEESHGHVILKALEDDTYILGESTEICAYLPIGVFVYDPEFGTFAPLQDPVLFEGVDDDTPDDEVEELDPDSANDEVYEVVTSVPDYDAQVMASYAYYMEIQEMAVGFESTPVEVAQVRELYPEVIEMLEVIVGDTLGLLDTVALMNAASYAIQEGISDERKREIAMGIFIDLYADEFGQHAFDLLDDEDDRRYAIITFESNVWHNRDMAVQLLESLIAVLKSGNHEDAEGLGFVYVSSVPEMEPEGDETEVETVEDLPDTPE